MEYGFAEDEIKKFEENEYPENYIRFDRGALFAYGSIKRLAEKLEKGEFDFDEEGYGCLVSDEYEIEEES